MNEKGKWEGGEVMKECEEKDKKIGLWRKRIGDVREGKEERKEIKRMVKWKWGFERMCLNKGDEMCL